MNLIQKEFSYAKYYDEQREYGFIQDISRSGLNRTMKMNIGKTRSKIAEHLDKSINKDLTKSNIAINNIETALKDSDTIPEIERKLIKRAGLKDNARTLNLDVRGDNGNHVIPNRNLDKERLENIKRNSNSRFYNKIKNAAEKDQDIIAHPSGSGTGFLAHEIGHIENRLRGNKLQKAINKRANSEKVRTDFLSFESTANKKGPYRSSKEGVESGKGSIRKAMRRLVDGKLIELEESNASKRGIKMLKEYGASPEEIKKAEYLLKNGLDSYTNTSKASVKSQLRNKIAIPSRRN